MLTDFLWLGRALGTTPMGKPSSDPLLCPNQVPGLWRGADFLLYKAQPAPFSLKTKLMCVTQPMAKQASGHITEGTLADSRMRPPWVST